jgi:hypothetical protein
MSALQNYQHLLETSRRVNWRLEDLIGAGRRLDFTRPFLPETFAQTEPLGFLSAAEKLKLNQIRARLPRALRAGRSVRRTVHFRPVDCRSTGGSVARAGIAPLRRRRTEAPRALQRRAARV